MNEASPAVKLYMIRHGQTIKDLDNDIICGHSDNMPLTTEGERQAWHLGEALAAVGLEPDGVYVSPAIRSQQTAELALAAMGCELTPIVTESIHEIAQGRWEGQSRRQHGAVQRAGIAATPWDFRAPGGGESLNDVRSRMRTFLGQLSLEAEVMRAESVALAFTHGLTTAVAAGDILGWTAAEIGGQKMDNTGLTVLEYQTGQWRVPFVNQSVAELSVH